MLYRKMPRNGDQLSILGFGCMRLPMVDGQIDEARAIAQIRFAVDKGVNYLDTAWPYHGGASESLVGKALQDGYRDRVKIATKLPSWLIHGREEMEKYLDAQLGKLQTDYIDYYLIHALNGLTWDTLAGLGVAEFLDTAKIDGRVVNSGFSFHGELDDFKRIIDSYSWDFCQIQYNYLDREYQAGLEGLRFASERGLGVIIMEPLRGGSLGQPEPPPPVSELWQRMHPQRTPAEWALRWVWNHPEVTLVLSGMNEESHIEENIAIADNAEPAQMSTEELELVNNVCKKYQELMKIGCTGCGYCLPCPENVSIPACFELYNQMHMFGNEEAYKFSYALRMCGVVSGGNPGFASQCQECGECLEKCPQQIPISDFLKRVSEEMEGPDLDKRLAAARKMMNSGK